MSVGKDRVRQVLERKEVFSESCFYRKAGLAQAIARSWCYQNAKLGLIVALFVWIAVDADSNAADNILDAAPPFILLWTVFVVFFLLDIVIRVAAFHRRRYATKDAWLLADVCLWILLVVDVWVLPFFKLRELLTIRGLQFVRVVHLLSMVPEFRILAKGLACGARSVFLCLHLLLALTFTHGVLFVLLLRGTDAGHEYFETVPAAMHSLLLHGILPGAYSGLAADMQADSWFAEVLFVIFILLVWCMIAVMLGVLCEVVSSVAAAEKESMVVLYVFERLMSMLECQCTDGLVTKEHFLSMMQTPDVARQLTELDFDLIEIVDAADDGIFRDIDTGMDLDELVRQLVEFRFSGNSARRPRPTSKSASSVPRGGNDSAEAALEEMKGRLERMEVLMKQMVREKGELPGQVVAWR